MRAALLGVGMGAAAMAMMASAARPDDREIREDREVVITATDKPDYVVRAVREPEDEAPPVRRASLTQMARAQAHAEAVPPTFGPGGPSRQVRRAAERAAFKALPA